MRWSLNFVAFLFSIKSLNVNSIKYLGHSPFSYMLLINCVITKDCGWETWVECWSTARFCALFKVYSVERAWKAIRYRLRRYCYLSRVDHVRKIRDRKQRTDIGKYFFVNRTIRSWNQLEALGTFHCKPKIFRKS